VNEGDRVVVDQPLVSVETDKAVVEVPSPWSGRIPRLFGGKGALVTGAAPPAPAPVTPLQVLPAVRALARKLDVDLNLVQASGPGGTVTRADVERAAKSRAEAGPGGPLRGRG